MYAKAGISEMTTNKQNTRQQKQRYVSFNLFSPTELYFVRTWQTRQHYSQNWHKMLLTFQTPTDSQIYILRKPALFGWIAVLNTLGLCVLKLVITASEYVFELVFRKWKNII